MVEPFPEEIARFLFENVESIDQLEILRVLDENRDKEWDVIALAREVQARPQAVRAHLTAMHSRGLLVTTMRGAGLSCRYGIGNPELRDMAGRLLQLYKQRPVTMIKMVYDRARDPLRDCADPSTPRRI